MASLFPKEKYIQYLLTCDALSDKVTVDTPMELNVHLCASDNEPLLYLMRCRHLVGSLVYLDVTRPDISYHILVLSQFVSAPTFIHLSHLPPVLRNLCGTTSPRLSLNPMLKFARPFLLTVFS